jgi:hypothetical protein
MKHIKEYEDKDIMDLIGDLDTVGHGAPDGWLIQIINRNGLTTGEILIAESWQEAQRIYSKFGMIKGDEGLATILASMKTSGNIAAWDIIDGFKARKNVKGYKKWDMSNPYTSVEILDGLFSNAKSITSNLSVNALMVPPGTTELKTL